MCANNNDPDAKALAFVTTAELKQLRLVYKTDGDDDEASGAADEADGNAEAEQTPAGSTYAPSLSPLASGRERDEM